ncbi:MAG: serine hydrolase [Chitinophagales bacterium]
METLHFCRTAKTKNDNKKKLFHSLCWMILFSRLFLLQSSSAQVQQALPASESQQIEQIVNEEIVKQELIGLAIGVVNNGQIAYLKGFGYEDRAAQKKVDLDSKFRWASMAKSLTSIAAMKLWENDKLDLDKDVHSYVENFPEKGVTMNYLLQNQSGIGHYDEMDKSYPNWNRLQIAYSDNQPYNSYLSVNIFADAPLQSTPGTQYLYSTFGFNLAGAVVEKAGKDAYQKGYIDMVSEYIASPLGMTTLQPDYHFGNSANEVKGYFKNDMGEIELRNDDNITWKLPAGGFHSTIGDLTKFMQGVVNRKILKSATYDKMWTKQDKPDKDGSVADYGYGFGVNGSGVNLRVWHSGSQTKTKTLYLCYPNQGIGVAVMCNSEWANPWIIADKILKVLGISKSIDVYEWNCDEKSRASKHQFTGVWQSGNSDYLVRVAYTGEEFDMECKDLAEKGYRLMDFETFLEEDERKWDGVFVKEEGKYAMWQDMNEEDFAAKVEEMAAKGLRLIDVETYRKSGETQKWAGVFMEGRQKYAFLQDNSLLKGIGLDMVDVFNKKYKSLTAEGLRLIDIETYTNINGNRKWVGVFIEGKDEHALHRNLSKQEFQAKQKELAKQGLRLIDVEVYTSKGEEFWTGVWREGGGKFAVHQDLRFCPFYKKMEELRNEGYELFDLERY